jgi:hypothetical protein
MLIPLSTIATATTIATQHTIHATNQILDYCATHPDATITYRASDMILKIHSGEGPPECDVLQLRKCDISGRKYF